jgi:hypothetical protein
MPGKNISPEDALAQSQITSIEHDGFWLLTEEGEFFVSFERYHAFSSAKLT